MHISKHLSFFPLFVLVFTSLEIGASASPNPCAESEETYSEGSFEVGVTRFTPAGPKGKLVLVMPPTGGTTRIDLSYGKSLCQKNITSIVVNRWTDDQEYNLELEIHDRIYRRAQRAIDILLKHSFEEDVGILGTSLGASHAAIASMRNDRISAIFLIVGGAPISSILVSSDQKVLREGKEKRFALYGFRSLQEYEAALKKVIPFEPLSMKPVRGTPRMGMAISNSDSIVPTRFQLQLKNAWKPTLVLESNFGHVGAILETWLCHEAKIVGFFEKNLSEPSWNIEKFRHQ